MLAREFGYSRAYVDTYINAPSFRSLIKYRNKYPPESILLRGILTVLGVPDMDNDVETSHSQSMDALVDQANTIKVDKGRFTNELNLIRSNPTY